MRILPNYQNIRIGGNDGAFHDQIELMIGDIERVGIGQELLSTINTNPNANILWIGKTTDGNVTRVVSNDISQLNRPFVKLRGLIRDLTENSRDLARRKSVADEFAITFQRAATRGRDKKKIARRIGAAPLEALKTTAWGNTDLLAGQKVTPSSGVERYLDLLSDPSKEWYVQNLKEGSGSYTFGDLLMQVLWRDLRSGGGQTTKIMFNPDIDKSCVGDGKMKARPPKVGLFHELVHAYRNVCGRRIFDDFMSCGLPDDELMTTGITPYDNVHFTENKIRSAWTLKARKGYR